MNWQSSLRIFGRVSLRSVAWLGVVLIAFALLDAPRHQVTHHEDGGAHHCAVCAFAKNQMDSPACACAPVAFELAPALLPVTQISLPVSVLVELLPPGRAPPAFLIPS